MKKIVFVDFFDTIMFRRVHPFQITGRWADNLLNKYGIDVPAAYLVKLRDRCLRQSFEAHGEAVYADALARMYDALTAEKPQLHTLCTKEAFVAFAEATEVYLETGVQYPNKRLLKYLHRQKARGAQIHIVSDFYMGAKEIALFCEHQEIDPSLFDGIHVSSDYGCKKESGELYRSVLSKLGASPTDVIMIGDHPVSDCKMAKANGIHAILRRHLLRKLELRFKRMIRYDYSRQIGRILTVKAYRCGLPFAEYITVFYSFTERLKANLSANGKAVFLAREGYYLKQLLEKYDYFTTKSGQETDTAYFMCSRRAITSTQEDRVNELLTSYTMDLQHVLVTAGFTKEEIPAFIAAQDIPADALEQVMDVQTAGKLLPLIAERIQKNRAALLTYVEQTIGAVPFERPVHFIDIGWGGSMQSGLEENLGIKTDSFYLGVEATNPHLSKHGLVFSEFEHQKKPTYYNILRTNIQLYEQLSAAPHGSAQTYIQNGDRIVVTQEWDESEKELYLTVIEQWQQKTAPLFNALCVWRPRDSLLFTNRDNARVILKSALFADRDQLAFLKKLDSKFVWNFAQDRKGTKYDAKSVKIDLSLLTSPDKYVRYLAKLQRMLPSNALVQGLYIVFAYLCSVYTRSVLFLKGTK